MAGTEIASAKNCYSFKLRFKIIVMEFEAKHQWNDMKKYVKKKKGNLAKKTKSNYKLNQM